MKITKVLKSRFEILLNYILIYILQNKARKYSNIKKKVIYAHDFIGTVINVENVYEEIYLKKIVNLFFRGEKLNTFIDIGANIGNHSMFFGEYFKKVISIEANKNNFELLKLNCPESKYKLINIAVSDKKGFLEIIPCPQNMGGTKTKEIYSKSVNNRSIINCELIDNLLKKEQNVDVMKLDIEGFEKKALIGARQIINKFHPLIIFEQNAWEVQSNNESAAIYLEELGYQFCILETNNFIEHQSKRFKKFTKLLSVIIFGNKINFSKLSHIPPQNTFTAIVAYHPSSNFNVFI